MPNHDAHELDALDGPYYPQSNTHEFNAFAHLVIEAGGYNDLTAINPYDGRRFWSPVGDMANPYDALRRLVDAMEAAEFLTSE